jgi:hypothetical protein
MTNLKQNLIERSSEIKMILERELRALEAPCTISDLMKRCGASRMPVEKHLKAMMAMDDFSFLGIIRMGGYDVVYRRVPKAAPEVERPSVSPEGNKSTEVE